MLECAWYIQWVEFGTYRDVMVLTEDLTRIADRIAMSAATTELVVTFLG